MDLPPEDPGSAWRATPTANAVLQGKGASPPPLDPLEFFFWCGPGQEAKLHCGSLRTCVCGAGDGFTNRARSLLYLCPCTPLPVHTPYARDRERKFPVHWAVLSQQTFHARRFSAPLHYRLNLVSRAHRLTGQHGGSGDPGARGGGQGQGKGKGAGAGGRDRGQGVGGRGRG